KGPFPIHIKLETGMNRLGFDEKDLPELIARIQDSDTIFIKSVFSHLAASEDPNHDDFSDVQISRFKENSAKITSAFYYPILRHI
ncbi:MAG TPA: hypothetical protein EYO31_00175, partial [Phycisphaerales bacterium]|nr:hypothetical protein [Phycisphaerales bacterium]